VVPVAREVGKSDDPVVRQGIAQLYTLQELGKFTMLRAKGGGGAAGGPNIAKLMMSDMLRLNRDVGGHILGADTMLMGDDSLGGGMLQESILFSPGPSIYGGTDQVPNKGKPFKDVPKNA
jgi:hypothetical protein